MPLSTQIHPNYEFFFPMNQTVGSGTPIDVSGQGKTLYAMSGLTDAEMWGTAGYALTQAAASSGMGMDKTAFKKIWNPTRSLFFHFLVKAAAPAASGTIIGFGRSGANAGFAIVGITATGLLRLDMYGLTTASGVVVGTSAVAALDSADHHVIVTLDGPTAVATLWIDGVLQVSGSFLSLGSFDVSLRDFGVGISGLISTDNTVALLVANLGLLVFEGSLPDQVGRMVSFSNGNRSTPIPAAGWSL